MSSKKKAARDTWDAAVCGGSAAATASLAGVPGLGTAAVGVGTTAIVVASKLAGDKNNEK